MRLGGSDEHRAYLHALSEGLHGQRPDELVRRLRADPEEIAAWGRLDETERKAIMAELPARLAAMPTSAA